MDQAKGQKFFLISLAIFFGGLLTLAIALHLGKQSDLEGEQTSYTQCEVFEKYDKKIARGQAHKRNYFIGSSCGTFRTSQQISESLEIGGYYDWSATSGNWANKPTISVAKPAAG